VSYRRLMSRAEHTFDTGIGTLKSPTKPSILFVANESEEILALRSSLSSPVQRGKSSFLFKCPGCLGVARCERL
jgi:hypothetical protein